MANNCCTINALKGFKPNWEKYESPCPTCGTKFHSASDCPATTIAWCSDGAVLIHNKDGTSRFPDEVWLIPWASIIASYGSHLIYIADSKKKIGEYTGHVS